MATSIRHFGELKSTQSMNYRYDQLHRIAAAHASKWEGIWTTVEGSYNTSYAYDGNGNIQALFRNNRDGVRIDELEYYYDGVKKNRLDAVKDVGGTAEGLGNTEGYEYKYDRIGNLVQNTTDGIADIEWNIYGKVEKVTKTPDPFGIQATVEYRYDGTGNRIMKKVSAGATSTTTTYLRDASGNVMAIYEEKTDQTLAIKEIPIYGSSRLGQYRPKAATKKTALGQRIYEFSNHLGNVLVTLTDNKVPQTDGTYESVVVSASDYYPFGMAMAERTYSNSEYRYGFNGKENDTDFGSHIQDYGFRLYSAAEARFLSADPLIVSEQLYPNLTPYQFASNNPITMIDLDGLEGHEHLSNWYYGGAIVNTTPEERLEKAKGEFIMGSAALVIGITFGYAAPYVGSFLASSTTVGTTANTMMQTGVVGATVSGTLTMATGGSSEEVATNYTSGFIGGMTLGGLNSLVQNTPLVTSTAANFLIGGTASTADNITKQVIEVNTGQVDSYKPAQFTYNFMSGGFINSGTAPFSRVVGGVYGKSVNKSTQKAITEKTIAAKSAQTQSSIRKKVMSNQSKGITPNKATMDKKIMQEQRKIQQQFAQQEQSLLQKAEAKINAFSNDVNAGLDAVGKTVQGWINDWWTD